MKPSWKLLQDTSQHIYSWSFNNRSNFISVTVIFSFVVGLLLWCAWRECVLILAGDLRCGKQPSQDFLDVQLAIENRDNLHIPCVVDIDVFDFPRQPAIGCGEHARRAEFRDTVFTAPWIWLCFSIQPATVARIMQKRRSFQDTGYYMAVMRFGAEASAEKKISRPDAIALFTSASPSSRHAHTAHSNYKG